MERYKALINTQNIKTVILNDDDRHISIKINYCNDNDVILLKEDISTTNVIEQRIRFQKDYEKNYGSSTQE
mgnify:CR=1 FL=1